MDFLYLIVYGCLRLRFLDVETNPGSLRPAPDVCRILCSNVRGPAGNLSDLTVASSQYDILLCSETLVSDMHHMSRCWFLVSVALSCCVGARCLGPVGWLHTSEMGCDSPYRNPDQDNRIFDCLLASMAAVQTEDVRDSFLFMGDLNCHKEWLGSTNTNHYRVAAFDFATVSGCDQLVVGPTHARGGTLELLMTDVPDLVRVAVVAPIGNLDHNLSVGSHFDGSGNSKLVCEKESFPETSCQLEYCLWCNTGTALA